MWSILNRTEISFRFLRVNFSMRGIVLHSLEFFDVDSSQMIIFWLVFIFYQNIQHAIISWSGNITINCLVWDSDINFSK